MLKKKFIPFLVLSLASSSLLSQPLTRFVDPFLGTGGHGHVYPGATLPFGMVQLSPDNGVEGWDWCAGYHYSSKTIAGFSHTHLSGTGIGDYCDVSVLPLTDTAQIRAEKTLIGFSHQNESARPGYYRVALDNGVLAELTATERTGYHRYQFQKEKAWIQFDMGFRINWDQPTAGYLEQVDAYTLVGYRFSTGWAKGQKVFFAARFSQPIQSLAFYHDSLRQDKKAWGKKVKALLDFGKAKQVEIQVALSGVGTDKALLELSHTANLSFDAVQNKADKTWEKELNKIQIDTSNKKLATIFYTALYRTCLAPVVQSDADGAYPTPQGPNKIFAAGKNKYTVLSQWDVFRALYPLFTLTQTQRLPDLINSFLQFEADNGLLPVWDISGWEANTMTGYHSIPIIVDAMRKGIKGFDYEKAYAAMRRSAFQQQRGTPDYIKHGYLPQDKHGWSVTISLEYAFDDWCIAQAAHLLGKKEDAKLFAQRSQNYRPLFDAQTGFFRSKNSQGKFIEPFDPLLSEHGFEGQYIEGTAWQHSFFVPHDIQGLAQLHGGPKKLVAKLDSLFAAPSVLHGDNVSADVTGLIGQYAHGNEPSHHIIYMYSALGEKAKAAHWIQVVTDSMYKTGPDGLTGNDDCGQMSAWYVWTALGLYPLNPAAGEYQLGYPLVKQAKWQLPNGKSLHFKTRWLTGQPKQKGSVHSMVLNGKTLAGNSLRHDQLLAGGELVYVLN